jgi:hypothetical protein
MPKKITILALLFTLFFAGTALATDVTLRPDHPDRYVVVKGDTLWDIAARFLKDPWLWPDIWYANPQIKNPHLIYPGDVIKLVYVNGKPQLRLQRGRPVVKLEPHVRSEQLPRAIPTIPLGAIRPFLARPLVTGPDQLKSAPYVVQSAGEHVITGAGGRVYVRGIKNDKATNYVIVRPGGPYRDGRTGEILGYEALYVGDAELVRGGDPATFKVVTSKREVRVGDRLVPSDEKPYNANFMPHPPASKVDGQIISVVDGVTQIGQYQTVVLDRGTRNGLNVGTVLAVYQRGQVVPDTVSGKAGDTVKLPDERAGIVMVFRTFDRVSYALVMRATTSMHVLDYVRNP